MIPTDNRSRDRTGYRRLRNTAIVLVTLLFVGCTNSKLIIGPLYNQLDDQIRSEYEKLGDFNDTQDEAFEQAVGTFHVWHRQSEMPKYAALIQEVAASIAEPDATALDDVKRWAMTAEQYSQVARQCHPANFLFGTMQTLTDKQIDFIEQRFKSERKKNRERYAKRTTEERIEHRLKNMEKWAGRIGLDFTASQRANLRTSLSQQVSLRKEYYLLSDEWNKALFDLARNQQAPDYEDQLAAHVTKLWSLMETAYPEQWQATRDLWQETAFELVSSMTPEQRRDTSRWLAKFGDTVDGISKDQPSFQMGTDPSVGCLVDSAS